MSRQLDTAEGMIAAFMFGYEAAALVSGGRVPTISSLCIHHRWLAAVMVISLAAHLVLADYADARAVTSIE
jgi:hypothetical protein